MPICVKPLTGSYFCAGFTWAVAQNSLLEPTIRVKPSAGACDTRWAAITPAAPETFSTVTMEPGSLAARKSAVARQARSTEPPGA
ncbi:hypothetical protein D3C86_1959510 [compost metagenome]